MADISIKAGATLSLAGAFTNEDGSVVSLVGASVLCQLRDITYQWIADLPVVVNAAAGTISIVEQATATWPVGQLRCDIRVTDAAGNVTFSETFGIRVRQAVSTGVPA